MKVLLAPTALYDLEEIGDFIAADSPRAAKSVVAALRRKYGQLATMAERHPLVVGREAAGLRQMPHGRYLIYYFFEDRTVIVTRVLHGARDMTALLGD